MNIPRSLALSVLLSYLFDFTCLSAGAALSQVQTLRLDPGWNLIAFQVIPGNGNPATVFGALGNDFVAAWTYDSASRQWSHYTRTTPAESEKNQIAPIGAIELGRAYWVYMNGQRTWDVQGVVPARTPGVPLVAGWNLIGVPVGQASLPEPVNMLSVLTAAGLDYDTILKWESGLYKKFTPADTDVDDFTMFDAGKGHWVRIRSPGTFVLQPKLLSSVRADVDAEPQGNYPSPEDLKISQSPTPLGPSDQTHIVFLTGEDSQQLAIGNSGGGILAWQLTWAPQDATNVNWLQASATSGITTIENDVIQLFLDRTRLPKGIYRGTLVLQTTAGDRSFQVVANVPDLRGEWRGIAQIAKVNGKRNQVADIDLHLDFFEDATVPGLVRGLLDSRNSLLWPVDVPLIGHSGSLSENRFTLAGGFVLPPGDQNNPPYATFATVADLQDVDWNCNDILDDINPYPFPIYRSVLLQGALSSSSLAEGILITGSYTETVFGMLPTPIRLEGTFTLRRQNPVPFANRRPIPNQEATTGTQPVVLRSFNPTNPLDVPAGRTTNILSFVTDLALQQVSVDVDFSDAPATGIRFILQSPSGQQIVLHDRANLSSLQGLSFPGRRRPVQSLDAFVNTNAPTLGGWRLIIENSSGTVGKLRGWSLTLQGQPVFNVAGRVINTAGGGLPAQVSLNGLPITATTLANLVGNFQFSRLPGIPLNFSASQLGFESVGTAGLGSTYTVPSYPGSCDNATRQIWAAKFRPLPAMPFPPLATAGFTNVGSPNNPVILELEQSSAGNQLLAAPLSGYGPLPVQFGLLVSGVSAVANIAWNFGDGTATNGAGLRTVEHTYQTSGIYTGTVTVASAVPPVTLSQRVVVMPSVRNSTYSQNFFDVHFTGGGSVPDVLPPGTNNPASPPGFAGLVMVQHVDCASFDIDRAPFTSAANRNFHQDGFTNGFAIVNPSGLPSFKAEDYNYQVTVQQWDRAGDCAYVIDDNNFRPHPTPGFPDVCNTNRYRMVCNLGPRILPPPNSEVLALPLTGPAPTFFPASPDPLLGLGANQIATARDLRLITGPLAADWKKGGGL